jgi:transcription elongation factor GreA
MDKVLITKEGLEKLKSELKVLKEVKAVDVAKRIQNARNDGDISENAEYESAKEEQVRVEGKIAELEEIIKNAKISDGNGNPNEITIGSKVRVRIDGNEEDFHIVGAVEANPTEKKISHESPLGASLLGKKIGEKVEVEAPIGTIIYTILNIS